MPLKHTILLFFSVLAVAACSHRPQPQKISRLDLAMSRGEMSPGDSTAFAAWAEIADFNGTPEEYAGRMAPFEALVIGAITSLDSIENVLGYAFADSSSRKIVAIASPFSQSVVTHPDGYIFVALNHYLGAASTAYAGFPEFMKRRKVMERMPVDIVIADIASAHEPTLADDTPLLNRLLYQGALLNEALKRLPEGTSEAMVLAMTPEEYEWCQANEARIWKSLVEQKLLYSTDSGDIDRLLRPAPSSPLISAEAPGQTALFSALKLVQAYENATGQRALPSPEFYNNQQSLIKSAYAPR